MIRKTVEVDGTTIRALIARSGKRQLDVAEEAGISKYRMSHLATAGSKSRVTSNTAKGLTKALGCSRAALAGESGEDDGTGASAAEQEIVRLYRTLSPLKQAQALIEMEKRANDESNPSGNNLEEQN